MRIAVVGPGAVGGLVGALLARAGHNVAYVARPATATALNEMGLTVTSPMFGSFTAPARAVVHLTEPVDLCIVAVKAPDLPNVLDALPASLLGADGLVVPLLNGWEHLDPLARHFGPPTVIGGAIRVEATRRDPTTIEHLSPFVRIALGPLEPGPRLDAVAAVLEDAGVATAIDANALTTVWEKLVFLAPFALITARWRLGIGAARDRHRAVLEALVAESTAVGAAFGATLGAPALMSFVDGLPPAMTSSLRRDLQAGRSHELDAIAGGVVRAGWSRGLSVEVHERLMAQIEAVEPGRSATVMSKGLEQTDRSV
jgi:2-dehydropantoate 2-reductase